MKHLLIKLRKHNMMQHWQSLMQLEGHLEKNPMLNLALNLSNLGDNFRNWLVFIKFNQQDYLSIYLLQLIATLLGNLLISHTVTVDLIHSRIDFFQAT